MILRISVPRKGGIFDRCQVSGVRGKVRGRKSVVGSQPPSQSYVVPRKSEVRRMKLKFATDQKVYQWAYAKGVNCRRGEAGVPA